MHNHLGFTITRLDTPWGMFRIDGYWLDEETATARQLRIEQLCMMGTDGWVSLDLEVREVVSLVAKLTPEVLAHLGEPPA